MDSTANGKALAAVDLGAQSCRVSLLRRAGEAPEMRVVHRFANGPVARNESLRWNVSHIIDGVKAGLRSCAEIATEGIASIGIDGWGVDYVRLGKDGTRLHEPFCYRDERNVRAMREVLHHISAERLYDLTGIQLLSLNTLFQLYADSSWGIDQRAPWLNLPEYVTHVLGGRAVAEYTNATHTQLVHLGTQKWCDEIFAAVGLAKEAAPTIVPTGTAVGTLQGDLSEVAALHGAKLIVPACHDTASAIAAIPATGNDWAFISSGTWSLVGTVLESPCVTEEARRMNFTNLGGVGNTICFLKNVNGMWLLQQCAEEWRKTGRAWSAEELAQACEGMTAPRKMIDVDDTAMLLPGDMPAKINAQLVAMGDEPISSDDFHGAARMANVLFHSLAKRYAEVLECVGRITGRRLKRLFIAGGGSRNALLNRLTAERTGLQVIPASSECTTIGNFAIQLAALEGTRSDGVSAACVARNAQMLAGQSLELVQ